MLFGRRLADFFTGPGAQPETLAALDDSKANLSKAQLIRRGRESQQINLKAVLARRTHKDNVPLQTGDVLFLPAREPAKNKLTAVDYIRTLPFIGGLFGLF